MFSPARIAANRVDAARSTDPRTPEDKAAGGTGTRVRVSLSHGAHASDETHIAHHAAYTTPPCPGTPSPVATATSPMQDQTHSLLHGILSSLGPTSPRNLGATLTPAASPAGGAGASSAGAATNPPLPTPQVHDPVKNEAIPTGSSAAVSGAPDLLASFTVHYSPTGPAETLLVRRIVAASLRIDLLERAMDALMELGERRALVEHLAETYAINEPKLQVRDMPNYAAMLRRYDGTAEPPPGYDLSLDPDPALCTLAYTLSSPRAALLLRHEAAAERRLHAAMRELHHLQAERRAEETERNKAITLPAIPLRPSTSPASHPSRAPATLPSAPPTPLPSTPSASLQSTPSASLQSTPSASHLFTPHTPRPASPLTSRQLLDAAIDAVLRSSAIDSRRETPPFMYPTPATPTRKNEANSLSPMPSTPPHENAFAYPAQPTPPRENEANSLTLHRKE